MELTDNLKLESEGFDDINFKMKWLSNQLQTKIYNVDFKFNDEYDKLKKSNKFLKYQVKYSKSIDEARKIKDEKERNAKIQELTLEFTLGQGEENLIEAMRESVAKTNELEFLKMVELFKLITIPEKPYPTSDEYWQNANLGLMKDVIEFFRKAYKLQ